MPLPYATTKPLTVPAESFNADHLATLILHGQRDTDYVWTFRLHPATGWDGNPISALNTVHGALTASMEIRPEHADRDTAFRDSPAFRDRALESAVFWTITETRRLGWRLATIRPEDDAIVERDRPVLIIATLVIANEHFVPDPAFPLLDNTITGHRP